MIVEQVTEGNNSNVVELYRMAKVVLVMGKNNKAKKILFVNACIIHDQIIESGLD
jgi:hypothetical protein